MRCIRRDAPFYSLESPSSFLAANVQDSWVSRSVIQSCAKLAYDHAQRMIELARDGKDPTGSERRHRHMPLGGARFLIHLACCLAELHERCTADSSDG